MMKYRLSSDVIQHSGLLELLLDGMSLALFSLVESGTISQNFLATENVEEFGQDVSRMAYKEIIPSYQYIISWKE